MQFIAICRRRTERFTDAEFATQLGPEADRVRELYAAGVIRQAFSRGDVPGAVLVIEAADAAEADAALASLPFAKHEMLDIEVIPLKPYRGFAGS